MRTIEPRAVFAGILTAVAIALPVGLLGQIVIGNETTNGLTALVFLVPILVAFVAGGFVAAHRANAGPLSNGALAGLGAFAVIQGVGVVRRLATGGTVSPASLAFAALLAYSCGLIGALVAQRRGAGRTGDPGGPDPIC